MSSGLLLLLSLPLSLSALSQGLSVWHVPKGCNETGRDANFLASRAVYFVFFADFHMLFVFVGLQRVLAIITCIACIVIVNVGRRRLDGRQGFVCH